MFLDERPKPLFRGTKALTLNGPGKQDVSKTLIIFGFNQYPALASCISDDADEVTSSSATDLVVIAEFPS